MKTLTHEWLKAASDDLLTIEHIIDEEHLSSIVAFHAEQTVEKCFKAVLEECGVEFPKTHDISRLYKLLEGFHHFEIDQEILLKVNEVYIDSRYPGEFGLLPNGKPTLADAREFYQFAKNVYAIVSSALEKNDI